MVCQRYIANPLTIDGFKFDLRLYVCVLSFAPMLEAYIHTEGFARYSSVKYARTHTCICWVVRHRHCCVCSVDWDCPCGPYIRYSTGIRHTASCVSICGL
jgi:hypothetical protein